MSRGLVGAPPQPAAPLRWVQWNKRTVFVSRCSRLIDHFTVQVAFTHSSQPSGAIWGSVSYPKDSYSRRQVSNHRPQATAAPVQRVYSKLMCFSFFFISLMESNLIHCIFQGQLYDLPWNMVYVLRYSEPTKSQWENKAPVFIFNT